MSTSLTIRGGTLPDPHEWKTLLEMADVFIKSGLLPEAVKTPAAAVLIMAKGRELGIQPLQALSSIAVIKGKPAASAELMLALIYRDHGDDAIRFGETSGTLCTLTYKRRSWTSRQTYSFTIQDAATAGLTGNMTWKQYPAAMLRARCISAVARMAFPDTIGGLYTPEELGGSVSLSDVDEPTIHVPQQVIEVNRETGEVGAPSEIIPTNGHAPRTQRELEDVQAGELAKMGQSPAPVTVGAAGVTPAQLKAIFTIARGSKGLTETQIEQMCHEQFGVPSGHLTRAQASDLITSLQGKGS